MYSVSDAWIEATNNFLAPEGFVEISCYIPEIDDTLVYTKSDLLSFTHSQTGSVVSGELPKNHIEFALDNSDGRWNPSNPRGMERHLSERLRITLRYGYDIDGVVEWIPGGVFYLSEWKTSPNSLEASFVARDLLEYMIDIPCSTKWHGTLYEVAEHAIADTDIPEDAVVILSDELKKYSMMSWGSEESGSVAEVLQKCANAAGCVMYQDREGALRIEKLSHADSGYVIPLSLSYSHPTVEFSKPLKSISIRYGSDESEYILEHESKGETQTLSNDFIQSEEQVASIAEWLRSNLRSRKRISGDFRIDPRVDLFDVVRVEDKYGVVCGAVITDLRYTFTGAFRGEYTGQVRGVVVDEAVFCGEVFTGEVS